MSLDGMVISISLLDINVNFYFLFPNREEEKALLLMPGEGVLDNF